MIRIMCVIPNPKDATSFYRGSWPLGRLQGDFPGEIQCLFTAEHHFGVDVMADMLFLQRPSTSNHVAIAEMHKRMGHPVLIDYDDDLFCVPEDNPTYGQYSNPETQKNIIKLACLADAITVTTEALANRFREIAKTAQREFCIRVIPNAVDEDLLEKMWEDEPEERKKVVFWRGSPTHQKDLMTVGYELAETAKKRKDWTFVFMGYRPWFVTQQSPANTLVADGLDILVYHEFLQKEKFPLMVVPLTDSIFNRAKSNIAWLEGTCSGSIVLAPDFPEWKKPGVVIYRNQKEFGEKLNAMIDGKINHQRNLALSREYIWENYRLSKANEMRLELIHDLAESRKCKTQSAAPWTARSKRLESDTSDNQRVLHANPSSERTDSNDKDSGTSTEPQSSVRGNGKAKEHQPSAAGV